MTAKLTASLAERVQRLEASVQIRDLMPRYAVATNKAPEEVTYLRTPSGWRIQSVRLQGGVFFPLREDVT